MTVESHNEYQSNIVMNRSPPHGRKRSSSKLRDPHDTTRVVNVSCASISFVQSSSLNTSDLKGQKDVNGGTDDISGVARIWCEETKRGVDCEDRDHWWTYGRPVRPWPLNFPYNFPENRKGQHGHFTKIHSISKFHLPFSRTRRRRIYMSSN